jgi:hypothetical protein
MQIEESLIQKYYLAERCFVRPEVRISNYVLKWNEISYGIPQREVSELKAFLKEILPYILGAFFKAAGQISKTIEEEVGDARQVRKIHDSFLPELQISSRRVDHEYVLQMREDGATVISRNETVTTSSGDGHDRSSSRIIMANLSIHSILGELVFIR